MNYLLKFNLLNTSYLNLWISSFYGLFFIISLLILKKVKKYSGIKLSYFLGVSIFLFSVSISSLSGCSSLSILLLKLFLLTNSFFLILCNRLKYSIILFGLIIIISPTLEYLFVSKNWEIYYIDYIYLILSVVIVLLILCLEFVFRPYQKIIISADKLVTIVSIILFENILFLQFLANYYILNILSLLSFIIVHLLLVIYFSLKEIRVAININDEAYKNDILLTNNLVVLIHTDIKKYLNGKFTLNDAAKALNTNRTYLSKAINNRYSNTFNYFLNYYRVKEICIKFIDNTENDIKDLCKEYGFNSLTSANNAFKTFLGFTLGAWVNDVKYKLNKNEKIKIEDYIRE